MTSSLGSRGGGSHAMRWGSSLTLSQSLNSDLMRSSSVTKSGLMPSANPPTSNLRSLPSKSPRPNAGNASAMRGTTDVGLARSTSGRDRIFSTIASSSFLLMSLPSSDARGATTWTCSTGKIFSSTAPTCSVDARNTTNVAIPITMPNADSTKWRRLRSVLPAIIRTRLRAGIIAAPPRFLRSRRSRRPSLRRGERLVAGLDQHAVAHRDHAAGDARHPALVGHDQQRHAVLGVELAEEVDDLLAGLGVEV